MMHSKRPLGIEGPIFVMQLHRAKRLHFDFRLEIGDVLVSWAIPKGPSLNPGDKRLAIQVADHAVSYAEAEGKIPEGNYGAGTVIVWDFGTWKPLSENWRDDFKKGRLKFELDGKKLKGKWAMVRFSGSNKMSASGAMMQGINWLLIKDKDEFSDDKKDITQDQKSALSGKTIEQLEKDPAYKVIHCEDFS